MKTTPHVTYIPDHETGEDTDQICAYIHPASQEAVDFVLAAKEGDTHGRSEYVWVRLSNGDLILGVFPRGDTYLGCEEDAIYPCP